MGCGGCWRVARGNLVMHFCNAEAVRVDEAQALAAALGRDLVIQCSCPRARVVDGDELLVIGAVPECRLPLVVPSLSAS